MWSPVKHLFARLRPSKSQKRRAIRRCRSRSLALESLETREVMTHDVVTGVGIVGDGWSDEYAAESFSYAKSWVELIAAAKGINVGAQGTWNEPRRTGYEFNWSREGADSDEILSSGQVTGLVSNITSQKVSHLVFSASQEDFALDSLAYSAIYNSQWSQSQIDQHVQHVLANIETALSPLLFSGEQLVVLNIPDPGVTVAGRSQFPDAAKRELVADVIRQVNTELSAKAQREKFALVDLFGLSNRFFGTNFTATNIISVGGLNFTNNAGTASSNLFVADGEHPHTIFQTVIANAVFEAFNVAYGNSFTTFSEAEAVAQAGLTYAGVNSLNLPYSQFVILPQVTVFLDYGGATDNFASRVSELLNRFGGTAATESEIATLQSSIFNGLEAAFDAINVQFTQTRPAETPFETLVFHRTQSQVPGSTPNSIGFAPHDWRNVGDSNVNYMFPGEFYSPEFASMPRNQQLTILGRALSFFAVHLVGHSFGLDHSDAFGDSRITSNNYTSTNGIEKIDFMSGNDWSAFDITPFKSASIHEFSPLSRTKLAFSMGLNIAPIGSQDESTSAHSTIAQAQPIELRDLTTRGIQGVHAANVQGAVLTQLSEQDLYSVTMKAGDLLTAQTLSSNLYSAPNTFDTVLRLKDANGNTLIENDDVYIGPNGWGLSITAQKQDEDAMILNFVAPANGTYYIEVTTKSLTGKYDLFVAVSAANPFPWRNPGLTLDVDQDGTIAPVDALLIINEINGRTRTDSRGRVPIPAIGNAAPPPFLDPSGDNFVAPEDALIVINFLNSRSAAQAGGEGEFASVGLIGEDTTPQRNIQNASLLAAQYAWASAISDELLGDLAIDATLRRARRLRLGLQ